MYLVGLKDLRRQRDQERLGWHTPTPLLPQLTHTPLSTHHIESNHNPTLETDDGTHDMFSPRREGSPDPDTTEMREVDRTIPISVSVPIPLVVRSV